MRKFVLSLIVYAAVSAAPTSAVDFLHGADVSFLPQVEAGGGVFFGGDDPADFFSILRTRGFNMVRLRLWHSPPDGHNGLAETLELAERARAAGFDLLLDLHYSDTWADPGHQTKPAAWGSLPLTELADSVRAYTRDILTSFADRSAAPAIVQIGNEITQGILWDDGRVGGAFDRPNQWVHLGILLQAAGAGIEEALPGDLRPEIMIHLDRGGDNAGARWFLDNLAAHGVNFDLIGLSFYPWWHGTLTDLKANLEDLAVRYGKDLVVVETAYPWTLGWFDDTHNLVGLPGQLLPRFAPTPEGQRAFLAAVRDMVSQIPSGRGRGVFWWAPEWITSPGFGSAWENLALFDEVGNPLMAPPATPPEEKSPKTAPFPR